MISDVKLQSTKLTKKAFMEKNVNHEHMKYAFLGF